MMQSPSRRQTLSRPGHGAGQPDLTGKRWCHAPPVKSPRSTGPSVACIQRSRPLLPRLRMSIASWAPRSLVGPVDSRACLSPMSVQASQSAPHTPAGGGLVLAAAAAAGAAAARAPSHRSSGAGESEGEGAGRVSRRDASHRPVCNSAMLSVPKLGARTEYHQPACQPAKREHAANGGRAADNVNLNEGPNLRGVLRLVGYRRARDGRRWECRCYFLRCNRCNR
jgi:hypothetical protein